VELINTFTVGLPVEDTWQVLTDLERIAPCLPGAALLGVDGDDYRGAVKIKVGPVSAKYEGVARFVERDDGAHRAVIRAEGKDVGGQGNAAATITASLVEQGEGTRVDVRTDLALSGRVAQFGRGVIADVSNKLLGQFVQRLEAEVVSGGTKTPQQPRSAADVEPLDVMSSMGGLVAKRALPVVGAVVALVVGALLARRKRPAGTPLVINLTLAPVVGRRDEEVA
jgi:carbon monoxide dehydrogenase subunit G